MQLLKWQKQKLTLPLVRRFHDFYKSR